MTEKDDLETLRRFVLRARRIQEHSMVKDWEGLKYHARGSFEGLLDITGRFSLIQKLPQDEEVFESLAARVRPLTLKTEPVYYVTVLDALERLLEGVATDDGAQARFDGLRKAWSAAQIQGRQVHGYALQQMKHDGSGATNMVSDTQLGAAWLYADLVHSEATGPKREALAFPLKERYAAAVRLFSHIAVLAVETLQILEGLQTAKKLAIPEAAWEEAVIVGESEFTQEARAFVAEPGSPMPDLRESVEFGEGWSKFTVTELLRQDPANHVRVVIEDVGGNVVASYEAAVAHRDAKDSVARVWHVLIAGSVMFKFAFDTTDHQKSVGTFLGWEAHDSTNELKLASSLLLLNFAKAHIVRFIVREQEFLSLRSPRFRPQDVRALEVTAEVAQDLVAIEKITQKQITPGAKGVDDRDRVRLRQVRLIWEGHIVNAMSHPLKAIVSKGAPPQVIVESAGTFMVGGAEVPSPTICIRHPSMTSIDQGQSPEGGSGARLFEMKPPEGERFRAWSPDRAAVTPDNPLTPTAEWALSGIDEAEFLN